MILNRDTFTVEIEKVVAGGEGLGRYDGRVVFVPFTCAGDVVRVKPRQIKKKFIKGDLVEILTPSPQRISPKCPHFTQCGGCDYQHISYDTQLQIKQNEVFEAFKKIGKIDLNEVPEIVASQEWGYRNRARLHLNKNKNGWSAGFKRYRSHDIEAIKNCPILVSEINTKISEQSWSKNDAPEVKLFGHSGSLYEGPKTFDLQLGDKNVFLSNQVFFQSNLSLLPSLIEFAIGGESGEVAMDLFSGVGLFSLYLQDSFKKVIAVEINKKCQSIAGNHLLDSVERYYKPVEDWVTHNNNMTVDLLLVDPPRQGIESSAMDHLKSIAAKKMVYVSCDPATMARDIAILQEGGYRLCDLKVFDMFPQTSHIEAVAKLEKNC